MVSLKIKNGTKHEVETGLVDINGPCVGLYRAGKKSGPTLVWAYHLNPGEEVREIKEGEYVVEL